VCSSDLPLGTLQEVFSGPASQAFGQAQGFGDKQKAVELAAQKQQDTTDLLGRLAEEPPDAEEEALLNQLTLLQGPAFSKQIKENAERSDEKQLASDSALADDMLKISTGLLDQKNPAKRLTLLRGVIAERQRKGLPTNRLAAMLGKTPDAQGAILRQMQVTSEKTGEFFKGRQAKLQSRLKREEEAAKPQPGFTLSTPGAKRFDAAGNVIASLESKAPSEETKTSLIKNMIAAGIDPDSKEGKKIIIQAITKPGVNINLNKENAGLFKTPIGFMLLDPDDPTKGVTPIPGGPKDTSSTENAAKTKMLQTAKKASKGVRSLVFNKDGGLDRANLFNAQFNVPGTDGRELRTRMEFGIQAITRLETGAAMPPEEVENTRTRFMPSVGDSTKIAKIKLDMFDDFLSGTLKLLDPSGRFAGERFQTELDKRSGGESNANSSVKPPPGEENSVFTGNKTPEGFDIFKRPNGSTFAVQP